jgi:uncharacterized membrane protein YsdA (DUF1294 family)
VIKLTLEQGGMLAGIIAILCLITFGLYAFDKSAARRGAQRVPEKILHLFALLGGWPGAFLAQKYVRHKTVKQPFRFVFWLTVIGNCGLLVWLFVPLGWMY